MVAGPARLRVTLRVDGGFAYVPGLGRPIELDAAQLGEEHAAQLRRLCDAACAVAPTGEAGTVAPIRDARRYRLTVETNGKRHALTAADPVAAAAIAELIAFVEAHGRRGTEPGSDP
jgi:hypothetical protein